jgi:hypothetical protein
MKNIKRNLNEYSYKCGDGCCDLYGTEVTVNGELLECTNSDTATIVENILVHLGYTVKVTNSYNGNFI